MQARWLCLWRDIVRLVSGNEMRMIAIDIDICKLVFVTSGRNISSGFPPKTVTKMCYLWWHLLYGFIESLVKSTTCNISNTIVPQWARSGLWRSHGFEHGWERGRSRKSQTKHLVCEMIFQAPCKPGSLKMTGSQRHRSLIPPPSGRRNSLELMFFLLAKLVPASLHQLSIHSGIPLTWPHWIGANANKSGIRHYSFRNRAFQPGCVCSTASQMAYIISKYLFVPRLSVFAKSQLVPICKK